MPVVADDDQAGVNEPGQQVMGHAWGQTESSHHVRQ